MLLLLAGCVPVAVALHLLAGPVVALVAGALFAAAFVLTLIAQREEGSATRDVETGLPDREAARLRLAKLLQNGGSVKRQAAVVIVAFPAVALEDTEVRCVTLLAAAMRMAQRLRKGDQILRVGPASLAVILGPSRSLDARAVRDILDRLDGVLNEPVAMCGGNLVVRPALGACLENDAPAREAHVWLEAAESAADIAAEKREPHIYWIAQPTARNLEEWTQADDEAATEDEARSA